MIYTVVIPAGVPRKPGMSRDDLFKINASIVRDLAIAAAKFAPKAFMCIISNPANSTVPIVAEVFKKHGVYDPRRIFGVTTLDLVRASTFLAELLQADPKDIKVPVIGGHSGYTIIPIISQVKGYENLTVQQIEDLTKRVQFAGDEVVKAKDGNGSATLSMAYAGARFTLALIGAAFHGENHVECAYVGLQADPEGAKAIRRLSGEVEYFATPVELGPNGIQRIPPVGKISKYEYKLLTSAVQDLNSSIHEGTAFVSEGSNLNML